MFGAHDEVLHLMIIPLRIPHARFHQENLKRYSLKNLPPKFYCYFYRSIILNYKFEMIT